MKLHFAKIFIANNFYKQKCFFVNWTSVLIENLNINALHMANILLE